MCTFLFNTGTNYTFIVFEMSKISRKQYCNKFGFLIITFTMFKMV